MKRSIPLIAAFAIGVFMFVQYFIPHAVANEVYQRFNKWASIIGGFGIILGVYSLLRHHLAKINRKVEGWGYSVVTLVAMVFMAFLGFVWGREPETPFDNMFLYVYVPLNATMFSILAFYIASAAFRAFRARTVEATLLLVAAVIVMLGRVPIGNAIHESLPKIADWVMAYPNLAAKRAIMIGVGLGVISTCVKIILGIERTYLGGEQG
jgi:hypothetical protein